MSRTTSNSKYSFVDSRSRRFTEATSVDLDADMMECEEGNREDVSREPIENDRNIHEAEDVLGQKRPVCNRCRIYVNRKLSQKIAMSEASFRRWGMDQILQKYDTYLHDPSNVGSTIRVKDMYKEYTSLYDSASISRHLPQGKVRPLSYRSFCRHLSLQTKMCLFRGLPGAGGSMVASLKTVRVLISKGQVGNLGAGPKPLSPEKVQEDLRTLCARYKKFAPQYREGMFDIVEEIRAVPVTLWNHMFACVESSRDRLKRRVALQECQGELSSLPLPYGNQMCDYRLSFSHLGRSQFRKMIRVLYMIQHLCFTLHSDNCGPLLWGFSCGISSKGGDVFLGVGNQLGVAVHPNVINNFKKDIYDSVTGKKAYERLQAGLFCAFAHDNIDADLHQTTVSDGGRSKAFHGTISIAQQVEGLPPIRTSHRYKPLSTAIKKASDMISGTTHSVQSAQALLLGVVALFGENLMNKSRENATTMGHILQLLMRGHQRGNPAIIEHLDFLELPSNSSFTTLKVLHRYIEAVRPRTSPDSPDFFLAVVDNPLYVRIWDAIYNTVAPGSRNVDLDAIVPVPGGMHFFVMCMNDVVKRLCFHGFMSGIIQFSGLTEGAAKNFITNKDPKTNRRVFEQVTCAVVRRIIDSLHESGDVEPEDLPPFAFGSSANSIEDVFESLLHSTRWSNLSDISDEEVNGIHFNDHHRGKLIAKIGVRVLRAIEKKASRDGQKNFKHFAHELVLNLLVPCVMCQYLSL